MTIKNLLLFLGLMSALPVLAAEKTQPHAVMIFGDPEYASTNTLPAFAKFLETNFAFRCTLLPRSPSNDSIPGLEALKTADLLFVFVRRTTLPEEQLNIIRQYLKSGKPLIGLRTASHAFQTWLKFDPEVLGGNYHSHYKLGAAIRVEPKAANHPILKNVPAEFATPGTLYKTSPLAANTTVLLLGSVTNQPPEPVAWTHSYSGGRVFYTSLGHPTDFDHPAFHQMLVNAVFWALDRPMPSPASQGP